MGSMKAVIRMTGLRVTLGRHWVVVGSVCVHTFRRTSSEIEVGHAPHYTVAHERYGAFL